MNIQQIIDALDALQDVDDKQQMGRMIAAVDQLQTSPRPEATEALLCVCERFPEHDGYETFWSILHVLEATPGYEPALLLSIARQPNEFNVLLLNRMLNVGTRSIGDTGLVDLLRGVAQDERAPQAVQKSAARFVQRHEA